jgi:hypothetical protein
MPFHRHDFIAFSTDAQRLAANLEQTYSAWLDAQRHLATLPASMYWAAKAGTDYLTYKIDSADNGHSLGARCPETEARYATYIEEKAAATERANKLYTQLFERATLYKSRTLRLPVLADQPGAILRALDLEDLLGNDVLLVGTNAFVAYELACGVRFPTGSEATEDFDLAWCRDTKASLASMSAAPSGKPRKTLLKVIRSIDKTYRINPRKPYQAINSDNYEVELLAAPSTHPLPKEEAFDPMASLVEQEWLLLGRPVNVVVATAPKNHACPMVVPDPRWMALHKLWLANKPQRNPLKKDKDRRQGYVLLDAVRFFLETSHPMNVDFVFELPAELRSLFDQWSGESGFIPTQ